MTNAGELRESLTIQTRTQTPTSGALGSGLTEVYSTLATVWGKVVTIKGSTRIDQVNAGAGPTHRFIVRKRHDIDGSKFILFDQRRFRILDVEDPDERGRFYDLLAEELGDVDITGALGAGGPGEGD